MDTKTIFQNLRSEKMKEEDLKNCCLENIFFGMVKNFHNKQYLRLFSILTREFAYWRNTDDLKLKLENQEKYSEKLEKFAVEREQRIIELKKKIEYLEQNKFNR